MNKMKKENEQLLSQNSLISKELESAAKMSSNLQNSLTSNKDSHSEELRKLKENFKNLNEYHMKLAMDSEELKRKIKDAEVRNIYAFPRIYF